MRAPLVMLLALLSLAAVGCAGVYTDIRKVDDNTYVVTRTKQGFFSTTGTLLLCHPIGSSADLKCSEMDSP